MFLSYTQFNLYRGRHFAYLRTKNTLANCEAPQPEINSHQPQGCVCD